MLLFTWLSLALALGVDLTTQTLLWHRGHSLFGRCKQFPRSSALASSVASTSALVSLATRPSTLVVSTPTSQLVTVEKPIQKRSPYYHYRHPRNLQPSSPRDVGKPAVTTIDSLNLASSIATSDPKPYEGARQAIPDPRRDVPRVAPFLVARDATAPSGTGLPGTASKTISNIPGATGARPIDVSSNNITGDAAQDALRKTLYLRTAIFAFWLQGHGWLIDAKNNDTVVSVFNTGYNVSKQSHVAVLAD